MTIKWSNDLSIGIEILDAQHRELYSRLSALLVACSERRGTEEVLVTMRFLENYVVEHFGMEEEVMRMSGYESFEEHKALHDEFRMVISALASEIEHAGVGPHTVVRMNRLLVDWLNQHIRKADRAMSNAVRASLPAAG